MTAIPAKRYAAIDRIIAAEIYLYIVFMFLTEGEAIRNILLFSAFILWLSILKYRENKWILKERIPLFFWAFILSILISVIFSIDFSYSLSCLKKEPLKSVIIFCLVSTVLSDEKRLKGFVYLSFAILVFTISVGYYSYWVYDLALMRPLLSIRHVWHNRFALDINTLLPFTLVLLLVTKDLKFKIMLLVTVFLSILAIVFSTSRSGTISFVSMALIFSLYSLRRKKINVKALQIGLIVTAVLAGSIVLYSPQIKEKYFRLSRDIKTFTERTIIWEPLIFAAVQRPVFGWGYGEDIFTRDEPFENTPFKEAPVHRKSDYRNPHNSFLKIFFHQGIVGVIPYIILIVFSVKGLWGAQKYSNNFPVYVSVACSIVIAGIYIVTSMVENPALTGLSFVLGMGVAANGLIRFKDIKMIE